MNDGNMIQEPPACPVCGLAVEERDPRRGKPLSIHRACRNRRREELRKERERGRRMSQESLLMASRNDVAEAAAELRRRGAWRNEAVGPADHGTVELCYWSVSVFCQIFVGRFGVSFSPFERLFLGRFDFGRSCGLSVIA